MKGKQILKVRRTFVSYNNDRNSLPAKPQVSLENNVAS